VAQALVTSEAQPYVDTALREIQSELQPDGLGPLTATIDVQAPIARGKGQVGVSRWPFMTRTVCYRTIMAETGDGWKVAEFGQTACPTS
jgi:hypothetical protein